MHTKTSLLLLAFLLAGCSQTTRIKTQDEGAFQKLNRKIRGHDCRVELLSGRQYLTRELFVTPDSAFWLDADSLRLAAATTDIERISVFRRQTVDGMGIGALAGIATGVLIGNLVGTDCEDADSFCATKHEAALLGSVLFVLPGALLGTLAGASTTKPEHYVFRRPTKEVTK